MLDTRTNEWLSRLQANGPKMVSLVFAALILLQLLQIGFSLFAKPVKSPQPVATGSAPPPRRAEVDVPRIMVSAHPFGDAAADAAAQDPDQRPGPPPTCCWPAPLPPKTRSTGWPSSAMAGARRRCIRWASASAAHLCIRYTWITSFSTAAALWRPCCYPGNCPGQPHERGRFAAPGATRARPRRSTTFAAWYSRTRASSIR